MKVYREGKFVEDPKYAIFEWEEGENQDEWRKKIGSSLDCDGLEFYFQYHLYSLPGFPECAVFDINFGDTGDCFITENFADQLLFVERFSRLAFEGQLKSMIVETIEPFFKKAFEAWHGHSLSKPCYQCDSEEMEAQEEWRRRRREREAAKKREANDLSQLQK